HGNNWNLMVDSKPERPVFKRVKQNGLVFRNAAFGINANAKALIQSLLGAVKHSFAAFGTVSVHENASALVEKTKNRDFNKLLFSDKYKRIWHNGQHEHNVHHRSMVGHNHVAFSALRLFAPNGSVPEAHPEQN